MTAAKLYDSHAREMFVFGHLLNTFREHADRFVEVMKVVKELRPESVLDLASNIGIIGALIRWQDGPVKRLTGVDISTHNTETSVSLMGYDRAICTDVGVWEPRPEDRSDLVFCLEILEHVPDPEAVVRRAIQASKKWVLISTPVEDGEVDGTFHVRKVEATDHLKWVSGAGAEVDRTWFVPSQFCEKHWLGWQFTLVRKES